ncbi:unnamed protein product [Durusdinium trenchii]|uniref:Uncharacterized protein n=1 Tax=Durusdinium trenchii TaxID=1381693 RepID=A0ABP0P6C3_9DINO
MSPLPPVRSHSSSLEGKLGKSTEEKERKSIQAAVESYYALPGVPDEELESVELQDFFDENGVIAPDSPKKLGPSCLLAKAALKEQAFAGEAWIVVHAAATTKFPEFAGICTEEGGISA